MNIIVLPTLLIFYSAPRTQWMRLVCVCAPASHRERASSVLFFFFFSKRLREERVVCLGEGGEKRTTWRTTVRTLCAQNLPVASVVCVRLVCVCVFFSSDASREKKGRCEVDGTRSSELSWVRWPEPPLSASFPEKKRPERERKREGSGEEVCAGCRGFQLLVSGSLS